MKCHDVRLCCFGVHIWRFEITPTYTPYGDQDGAKHRRLVRYLRP